PDPLAVQATLAGLHRGGARAVAMEVSSHGQQQGRVEALAFDIAVFTNLSRDHPDYHGTMEAYSAAKARLFAWPGLACRVINLDDPFGRQLAEQPGARLYGYSLEDTRAAVHCRNIRFDDEGVSAELVTPHGEGLLRSSLLGRFNLSTRRRGAAALRAMDHPLDDILRLLPPWRGPVGRMQRLGGGDGPLGVVDTPTRPMPWKRCSKPCARTSGVACSACSVVA